MSASADSPTGQDRPAPALDRGWLGSEDEPAPVEEVAPGIDQQGRRGDLGRGSGLVVAIEAEEPALADRPAGEAPRRVAMSSRSRSEAG